MATTELAIEVTGLTRLYRRNRQEERVALDIETWTVKQGEIHGLLGPNGAGKTTLCRILATILEPTSGEVLVLGRDVIRDSAHVRESVGIVFGGDRGLYPLLTAEENLHFWAALHGIPRRRALRLSSDLLARVGLSQRADSRVDTLSRGMKQRLHLARGLVSGPALLILDEPGLGLDPVATRDLRQLMNDLRAEGTTVLITTHDMREAEVICDTVSLIDHGRVIGTASPANIGSWLSSYITVRATVSNPGRAEGLLAGAPGVVTFQRVHSSIIQVELQHEAFVSPVLRHLGECGATAISTSTPTLEDVYLRAIGERGLDVQ